MMVGLYCTGNLLNDISFRQLNRRNHLYPGKGYVVQVADLGTMPSSTWAIYYKVFLNGMIYKSVYSHALNRFALQTADRFNGN